MQDIGTSAAKTEKSEISKIAGKSSGKKNVQPGYGSYQRRIITNYPDSQSVTSSLPAVVRKLKNKPGAKSNRVKLWPSNISSLSKSSGDTTLIQKQRSKRNVSEDAHQVPRLPNQKCLKTKGKDEPSSLTTLPTTKPATNPEISKNTKVSKSNFRRTQSFLKTKEQRDLFEKQRTVIYALNAIMRESENEKYEEYIKGKLPALPN
ncbi:unnamed protein product [Calicophoron daubneyi]|uniref:Uncharacterized protein n=1 Tax=Calicophoron daubneyi TaxID=300641 RepID=A0AAV2TBE1_CALDB